MASFNFDNIAPSLPPGIIEASTAQWKERSRAQVEEFIESSPSREEIREVILSSVGIPHDKYISEKVQSCLWDNPSDTIIFGQLASPTFTSPDPQIANLLQELCAHYISELFDRCLGTFPPPTEAWDEDRRGATIGIMDSAPLTFIIGMVQDPTSKVYLLKFLRCRPLPCKQMAILITRNILAAISTWQAHRNDTAAKDLHSNFLFELDGAIYFLFHLLIIIARKKPKGPLLPSNYEDQLVEKMEQLASEQTEFVDHVGKLRDIFPEEDRDMMRDLLKSFCREDKCLLEGCDATTNLRKCARCGTAYYCSEEHQRLHWKGVDSPHRYLCFEMADY